MYSDTISEDIKLVGFDSIADADLWLDSATDNGVKWAHVINRTTGEIIK